MDIRRNPKKAVDIEAISHFSLYSTIENEGIFISIPHFISNWRLVVFIRKPGVYYSAIAIYFLPYVNIIVLGASHLRWQAVFWRVRFPVTSVFRRLLPAFFAVFSYCNGRISELHFRALLKALLGITVGSFVGVVALLILEWAFQLSLP